jgi:hypothetical protein
MANRSVAMLELFFDDHIILKNLWSLPSPDWYPPGHYLQGYLEDYVYVNDPHTIKELQQHTERCISGDCFVMSQET